MLGKAGHTKFDLARDSWSLICGFANSQLIGRDRKDKYVQVNIQGLGQLSEMFWKQLFWNHVPCNNIYNDIQCTIIQHWLWVQLDEKVHKESLKVKRPCI